MCHECHDCQNYKSTKGTIGSRGAVSTIRAMNTAANRSVKYPYTVNKLGTLLLDIKKFSK